MSRYFEAGNEPDEICVHPSLVFCVWSYLIVPLEIWYVFVQPRARTGESTTEALTVC